jgi:hypothetical protein
MAPPPPARPGSNRQSQDFGGGGGGAGDGGSYEQKSRRPEMRGPSSDVSDMMSRLKTKTINIQQQGSSSATNAADMTLNSILSGMGGSNGIGNDLISVTDLGDIPADSTPHKSKRRPRSERNTVSLDL